MEAIAARKSAARESSTPTPVVELRQVTKTYGTGSAAVHALRGVSLRIAAGEFVAVMGPSTRGRTIKPAPRMLAALKNDRIQV